MQANQNSSALNPFAGIAVTAQQLGLGSRPTEAGASMPVLMTAANGMVTTGEMYFRSLARCQELRAHKDTPAAAEPRTQQAIQEKLGVAISNNTTIVQGANGISSRVRALKTKECIPVELAHQEDFVNLLRAVLKTGPSLPRLLEDLAWAAATSEPGVVWEERLQPLLATASKCQSYTRCIVGQDELVASVCSAVKPASASQQA